MTATSFRQRPQPAHNCQQSTTVLIHATEQAVLTRMGATILACNPGNTSMWHRVDVPNSEMMAVLTAIARHRQALAEQGRL